MNEAFDCCIGDLGTYADTAREFSELPEPDSSAVHAETDVESLQTRLSRSVTYPGGMFGGLLTFLSAYYFRIQQFRERMMCYYIILSECRFIKLWFLSQARHLL